MKSHEISPRPPKQDEFDNLLEFLDVELRPQSSWSIREEYPTTFHSNNHQNIRIIEKDGEILSHAAIRPLIVRTPLMSIQVAEIGSVFTNPKFRNQGLSQKVLSDCLARAKETRADISILWTNLYEFYRKLGFELAGTEYNYLINRELDIQKNPLKIIEGSNVDPQSILKLYSKHTVLSNRSANDVASYLKIPNSFVFTAWDRNGVIKAFAVVGKGVDLKGYVHEWGGDVPDLLTLLNYVRSRFSDGIQLICGPQNRGMHSTFKSMGLRPHIGYLGMIKILDPEGFCSKITKSIKQFSGEPTFNVDARPSESFVISLKGQEVEFNGSSHFTRLIFGPNPEISIRDDKDGQMKLFLEKYFPLDFWIWGWDSI